MSNWLWQTGHALVVTFGHNWPILLVGTIIAAATRVFVSQEKLAAFLKRNSRQSIVLSVAAAVLTPLCSCGTMAVVLAMLASVVPWGPIVAFIVASPLTSPPEFFYVTGFLGGKFAVFHLLATTGIGLAAGFIADRLDRAGWLAGQARYHDRASAVESAGSEAAAAGDASRPGTGPWLRTLFREWVLTTYRVAPRWVLFAALGYGILYAMPSGLAERLLGNGHAWSVPAAALLGLPLYINAEASVPMLKAFVDAGMGPGAAMAFFITGPATSVGALAGLMTIARSRVILLVLATIFVGAIVAGLSFQAVSALL